MFVMEMAVLILEPVSSEVVTPLKGCGWKAHLGWGGCPGVDSTRRRCSGWRWAEPQLHLVDRTGSAIGERGDPKACGAGAIFAVG